MATTENDVLTAMDLANRYLEGACTDSGRFRYRIHLDRDIDAREEYNILRHAGAVYAMASYAAHRPQYADLSVLDRAVGYLLRTAVADIPGQSGLSAVWSLPDLTDTVKRPQAKLGGAGLGLMALLKSESLLPGPALAETLPRLAAFICYMQKPDGSFYSKYFPDSDARSDSWTSLYYPGEAALALFMLDSRHRDPRWRQAAQHALAYLAGSRAGRENIPPDHWALIASAHTMTHGGAADDHALYGHAERISERLLQDLNQELAEGPLYNCALATRLEGLLASLDIVPESDSGLRGRIIGAVQSGMRHLLSVQIRQGKHAGAIPHRVMTGGEDDSRSGEVRIDYVQHTLSALIEYHRRFDILKRAVTVPIAEQPAEITGPLLEEALALGKGFLLGRQKPAGNFAYEYDWTTGQNEVSDNSVRQAGAGWALALLHRHRPDQVLSDACSRCAGFFEEHSACGPGGARFIRYPGDEDGALGTMSLNALALIDFLACGTHPADIEARYRGLLRGYMRFIGSAMMGNGQWHGRYRVDSGEPYGDPSAYFDGESLLAVVRAVKTFDEFSYLKPMALRAAATGFRCYVLLALRRDRDSAVTKGYYQWASMAFYELATSGWDDTGQYVDHVLYLADWMIDTHRVLDRSGNTAYAFEGLIHAYRLAASRGETARAARYKKVILIGLSRLSAWQVGHSLANRFIRGYQPATGDLGGVQNHAEEGRLRIDVTQHQMHAVILALKYVI